MNSASVSTTVDSVQTTPPRSSYVNFNWPAHGLRGLAAAGVFVGHIAGGLRIHIYADNPEFVRISEYILNLGTYGVELFFVISGYVIAPSAFRYDLSSFFARRIVRIYPVFLFFTLLFVAGNLALNLEPEKRSFQYVIANIVFLDLFSAPQPNQGGLSPNAWSIAYEMWFYFFTGIAAYFLRHSNKTALALAVSFFAAFIYVFPISLYFVAGILCYFLRHRKGWRLGKLLHPIEFAALVVVVAVASQNHIVYLDGDFARPEVVTLLVATALLFFSVTEEGSILGRALTIRPLRFLGTISYSLYLSHPYVYFLLRAAFWATGLFALPVLVAVPMFYVITTIGALIFAYLVNITLERKPYEIVFRSKVYHADATRA